MKTILILFFICLSFEGNSQSIYDDYIRRQFKAYKQMPVEGTTLKDLRLKKVIELASEAKDSALKKELNDYISEISEMTFPNESLVDLAKIEKRKLKGFQVTEDKFRNTISIKSKRNSGNWFYPYIFIYNGVMNLRLNNNFYGSDWIFMDSVEVIVNGKKYEYDLYDVSREIKNGGSINESSTVHVNRELFEMLKDIQKSPSDVSIRFEGEFIHDFQLSEQSYKKVDDILSLFESLKIIQTNTE